MTSLVVLARACLALVLVVSALSKVWAGTSSTRGAADALGAPRALRPLAPLLPAAELGLALLLVLPERPARAGAALGGLLLLGFTYLLVQTLRSGRATSCRCFGALSSSDISRNTVLRNLALVALAAIALLPGGGGVLQRVRDNGFPTVSQLMALAGLALAVVLALALRELLQRYGRVLQRLEAIEASSGTSPSLAPDFAAEDRNGLPLALTALLERGRPLVLLFMSPSCAPCRTLAPQVQQWQALLAEGLTFAVISDGSPQQAEDEFGQDVLVLREEDEVVSRAYGITGTPAAVLVSPQGQVVGEPAYGGSEITELIDLLAEPDEHADEHEHAHAHGGPVPGAALPDVPVEDDQGRSRSIQSLAPQDGVVLLWDTTCGYCRDIQDELLDLDGARDLPVLVVSEGDRHEASTAFRSPVVGDTGFTVGRSIGAPGTPSAARVANGVLSGDLAVGGPAVLEMIRSVSTTTPSPF